METGAKSEGKKKRWRHRRLRGGTAYYYFGCGPGDMPEETRRSWKADWAELCRTTPNRVRIQRVAPDPGLPRCGWTSRRASPAPPRLCGTHGTSVCSSQHSIWMAALSTPLLVLFSPSSGAAAPPPLAETPSRTSGGTAEREAFLQGGAGRALSCRGSISCCIFFRAWCGGREPALDFLLGSAAVYPWSPQQK